MSGTLLAKEQNPKNLLGSKDAAEVAPWVGWPKVMGSAIAARMLQRKECANAVPNGQAEGAAKAAQVSAKISKISHG